MEYLKGRATAWPEEDGQAPQTVYFTPPKAKNYNIRWLLLWQDESEIGASIVEQAKSKDMTLTDYRVRDFLMGTIGIGNYVFVNQSEVARKLSVHKVTVCESIKRLCEMGILVKGPKSGRSNTYMVSPAFCFAGGLGNGIKARKEAIKNHKAKVLPFYPKGEDSEQGSLLDA